MDHADLSARLPDDSVASDALALLEDVRGRHDADQEQLDIG
jgi:hypothetical protein